jgi:hypothetical protein
MVEEVPERVSITKRIFNRKAASEPIIAAVVLEDPKPKGNTTPKKGQPTRSRSDAEAARRKPIVQSTATRQPATKEEKVALRTQERIKRDESYRGMKAGEEKHLPVRDKGAQRRYVRDFVDARWNIGEFFMPVAFLLIAANFAILQLNLTGMAIGLIMALYALVFAVLIDAIIMWNKLKGQLNAKFKGGVEKGTMLYAVMRACQVRRLRIPKPTFPQHGNYPH